MAMVATGSPGLIAERYECRRETPSVRLDISICCPIQRPVVAPADDLAITMPSRRVLYDAV
jgi:hypothetical protein